MEDCLMVADVTNICWKFSQYYCFVCLFDCFFCLRWHVIGCINHDIVISLCYELRKRFSYYIHPKYRKEYLSSGGNQTSVLPNVRHQLYPLDQSAKFIKNMFKTFYSRFDCSTWNQFYTAPHSEFYVHLLMNCLNACFMSDHQTFCSLFTARHVMGALIMS